MHQREPHFYARYLRHPEQAISQILFAKKRERLYQHRLARLEEFRHRRSHTEFGSLHCDDFP
jgi:hypothetical protein